jgi:hypothetical protein
MFHYMTTQVAPESHTLHLGLVWSGSTGTCPMGRDLFFLLIIMIGHGDVWKGTSSTDMSMPIQFLGNRFGGHRYFILRIPTKRILYVCRGQTIVDRVVYFQQEDCRQRLAWDPGIAGLSSSLNDRGEWTIAGESYSNFSFSTMLEGASRRHCSTSFWHHHVELMETMWILVEI